MSSQIYPSIFVGIGLFYKDGPILRFEGSESSGELDLESFLGKEVRILAFHHPLPYYPKGLPGFGSCLWREGCPFGHGENPHNLLSFDATGILSKEEKTWRVGDRDLPTEAIPGHRCIVSVVPTKWDFSSGGVNLEGLGQLRAVLDQIKAR